MTVIKTLLGSKFGLLTVLERVNDEKWLCECACGKHKVVAGRHLQTGDTKSCGCLRLGKKRGSYTRK